MKRGVCQVVRKKVSRLGVILAGAGTHQGNPVTFMFVAANGGAGVGSYNLVLSDRYTVSGALLNGSVQLQ